MNTKSLIIFLLILNLITYCCSKNSLKLSANISIINNTKLSDYLVHCFNNSDCSSLGSNLSRKCVDSQCRCAPNYGSFKTCQYFLCNDSIECGTYDLFKFCSLGDCLCYSAYGDKHEIFHDFKPIVTRKTKSKMYYIVGGAVILSILALLCCQIHRCTKNRTKFNINPIPSPNTIADPDSGLVRYI